MTEEEKTETVDKVRELLLFQLKLFADAGRDLLLSPVAVVCFILDLGHKGKKEDTYFEKLMAFGRRTDHHINLFKHRRSYKKGMMTVDDAAKMVEETLVHEIKTGELTEKGYQAVKDAISKRFANNGTNANPDQDNKSQ